MSAPRSVTAVGGTYAMKDNREIPDTLQVIWEWDGPTLMLFTHHDCNDSPVNAQGAELAFTYQGEALGKRVKPLASSVGATLVLPCDVENVASPCRHVWNDGRKAHL